MSAAPNLGCGCVPFCKAGPPTLGYPYCVCWLLRDCFLVMSKMPQVLPGYFGLVWIVISHCDWFCIAGNDLVPCTVWLMWFHMLQRPLRGVCYDTGVRKRVHGGLGLALHSAGIFDSALELGTGHQSSYPFKKATGSPVLLESEATKDSLRFVGHSMLADEGTRRG